MVTIEELYWAAGFLEGEGCFSARLSKRWNRYNPLIDVAQVNVEPLEKLQKLFGGGRVYLIKPTGNRQQAMAWRLNGRKAIAVMMTLWPLMSQRRRRQIELAIEHWKSNKGTRSRTKITYENAEKIRSSSESNNKLAKKFLISSTTVWKIKAGKIWTHPLAGY